MGDPYTPVLLMEIAAPVCSPRSGPDLPFSGPWTGTSSISQGSLGSQCTEQGAGGMTPALKARVSLSAV